MRGERMLRNIPWDEGSYLGLAPLSGLHFVLKVCNTSELMGKGITHFPQMISISRLYIFCDQSD